MSIYRWSLLNLFCEKYTWGFLYSWASTVVGTTVFVFVFSELLWTAPEILRVPGQPGLYGTLTGDVYSFAIVMQEVVIRGPPFCMLDLSAAGKMTTYFKHWKPGLWDQFLEFHFSAHTSHNDHTDQGISLFPALEIIEKLCKPPPLCRPVVSPDFAPLECIQLMKQCWNEQPDRRPTFDEIFDQVPLKPMSVNYK